MREPRHPYHSDKLPGGAKRPASVPATFDMMVYSRDFLMSGFP